MRRLMWGPATLVIIALFVLAGAAYAEPPTFQGKGQKYREKNPAGGKGRAGGATMVARMLFDKDGTTLLEATTGDFDADIPPTGDFTKVKATALDANGVEMFSYTYNNVSSGPTFRQTLTGLSPGQPFVVQGHIRSATRKNTPVSITTSVQRRPDLMAQQIYVPSRVPVGLPVQVVAVIAELNAHIGGRTDCVLYADGVELDRGRAIWVDSGDSVSCAFSPTFPATGLVTLKVAAESVNPGDWDTANNSLERVIEVLELTPQFDLAAAEVVVADIDNTTFREAGRYVDTTLLTGFDWLYEESVDRNGDGFVYSAVSLGITETPSNIQLTATDGVVQWTLEQPIPGCFNYAPGRANGRSYYTYVTGCGNLYVEVGSYSGTVTYASRMLAATFKVVNSKVVYDGPAEYIYNTAETEVGAGENRMTGGAWTIDAAVTIGPFVFSAPVSVVLSQSSDTSGTNPQGCESTANSYKCSESTWRIAYRTGSNSVTRP